MSLDSTYVEFSKKYLDDDCDIFAGILNWCEDSRKLQRDSYNCLDVSESLSTCLSGKLPRNFKSRKSLDVVNREYARKYIEEVLCYVYDKDVENSVIRSLMVSKKKGKLTFNYIPGLDFGQKSRVRILCRVLWNDLFMKF